MHALLTEFPVSSQLFEMTSDSLQFLGGYLKETAFVQLLVNGGSIAQPGIVRNLTRMVCAEMPEVGCSRCPALVTTFRLVIDVEGAVRISEDDRLQALARGHDGIVLRAPGDEVLRIGSSEHRTAVIDLEYESP